LRSKRPENAAASSGDVALFDDSELDVALLRVTEGSLPEEEISDAVIAEASEGTTSGQIFAILPTHLADNPSPAATVTYPGPLMTKVATVSHASPFDP
jgi:hypothetical protein